MSKLNKDILFLIFEELQDNSKYLFSCLMVNRIWSETVIPILWRNPWRYAINYSKKNSLYTIITVYLSNYIKEFLSKKGIKIKISGQSLAFDYLSFCRSINIKIIDDIISIGSSSEYNRFLLQEEIYSFLIKKCPEIKYLNICDTYEIVYLPEAKVRLESLCELTCDTLIDSRYFYRLAHICQQIQRIIIINKNLKANHGTAKLIEFQKNLKYFKWVDDFVEDYDYFDWEQLEDPYTEIFNILEKHANTLNHFEISFLVDYNYDYTFLLYTLLELQNLKILAIYSSLFLDNADLNKKLEVATYRDLEILEIDYINIYQATYIIKNSLYLRELRIADFYDNDNFNDGSLNFIRTICENCYSIEYLTIPVFPLLETHFIEFEKLLKKCQKLRSLNFKERYYEKGKELEFGDYLSNVLIREASTNLREIGIPYDIKFSLKTLETFFEKWKGRPAVSIYLGDICFYRNNNSYMKLFDKYKIEGVIKNINV
ncbi:6694_t:CDS:1 [Rhizophagus irregularis]|nr:6694_t:CDS:1 [Rhizophagus irregularis]